MYFDEFISHDRIQNEVLKTLKNLIGLRSRNKKLSPKDVLMEEPKRKEVHVFGKPLHALKKEEVILSQSKEPIDIPEFLLKACSYIEKNITIEGLFRKAGSSNRQKEIKAWLDKGGTFDSSCHVIDVANILKTFLRELPEPLIPYKYHDTFLRCMQLQDRRDEAVILSCLLLPKDHLNALAFFTTFLNNVASHSDINKMTVSNLAIIIAPSIMPVSSPKMTSQGNQILNHHVQICQILIKNANLIGVVPEHILSGELSFTNTSNQNLSYEGSAKKKKKRRSGSLTRVFNGLKKMVGGRGTPEFDSSRTPDNDIHTPCIMSTGKKRKAPESASAPLSSKKKKELMQSLPQGSVLSDTPYKSYLNHKGDKLTPRILVAGQKPVKSKTPPPQKIKRRFFSKASSDGYSQKPAKLLSGSGLKVSRISLLGRSSRKKKEKEESIMSSDSSSLMATIDSLEEIQSLNVNSFSELQQSEEYVRVPKSEYEAIKKRVSKIESRLSHEFENIVGVSISDTELTPNRSSDNLNSVSTVDQVQNVYKKTLRESDKFSNSSTEELAKLLSQELNIRSNPENKIIRSPSARKIGSLRRRSKENCINMNINSCSVINSDGSCSLLFHPNKSLRRGKPNTLCTGLPHPQFKAGNVCIHNLSTHSTGLEPEIERENFGILTRSQARRASSFHGLSEQQQRLNKTRCVRDENEKRLKWNSSEKYFDSKATDQNDQQVAENRRESIAKLRCQNAGMVLAKAKLFDNMGDTNFLSKEPKVCKNVSKVFRHNNSKTRSSVRRKPSDKKTQENTATLINCDEESNNSLGNKKYFNKVNNNDDNNKERVDVISGKPNNQINDDLTLQMYKNNFGKENLILNNKTAQTDFRKGTVTSPLKDSNRTPTIKHSLTVNLTSQLKRTPKHTKSVNRNTPMRPLSQMGTPRRSPRLLLKNKNLPPCTAYN